VRIAVLLGRSFTDGSIMPAAVRLLTEWGAAAHPLHLGDDLNDVARVRLDYDLYVLKSKNDLAMGVAADLHGAGAVLLNPYAVSAMLRDRIVTFRVLRAAGVPVPETYVASHVSQLLPALDRGPLIVKRHRSFWTPGGDVVTNATELAALGAIEEPVFAQRYHPPDGGGVDRKIYSIGSELFGVLRVRPARTHEEKLGRPFTLSPELVKIARRCGTTFGIDLFGVDIVVSGGQPYVVDMSSFPGFRGVPDAPLRLAKYVYAAAERASRGEPIVPADSLASRAVAAHGASNGSSVGLVLQALATAPATPQELDQIQKLLDEVRTRSEPAKRGPARRGTLPVSEPPRHTRVARGAGGRVAIYSQDSLGLGHLRRNTVIGGALLEATAESAVLLFADSPVAPFFPVPERMDHVKLPSIRKVTAGCWEATRLRIDEGDLIGLRANLLRDALLDFRPDVVLVDHMPGGARGELIPALKVLKQVDPSVLIVLGVRDILDAPEVITRVWEQEGASEALRRYYDAVLIYGSSQIFQTHQVYQLPALPHGTHYCGYVVKQGPVERANEIRQAIALGKPRSVFVSAGGGGDGQALMRAFVQAVRVLGARAEFGTLMAVGANAPPELQGQLEAEARGLPMRIVPYVEHSRSHMAAADLVVCMAGYNTLSEVLYLKKKALVVPRPGPSAEQRMRAGLFAERSLIDLLDPTDVSPEKLALRLVEDLERTDYPAEREVVPLDGARQAAGWLRALLREQAEAKEQYV
jgi:predicted glycosyltransferase/glutathione synthase/RimK-type ligase-like ATP-grasp enzyme